MTPAEKALWEILDDIDTAGDVFKPENDKYFRYVSKRAAERHKYMRTDGHKLFDIREEGKLRCIECDYSELLMEVQNKIPGETRHETARRIIRQHETPSDTPAKEATHE